MENKQELVLLGQIMGRLDARAELDKEFRERLTRIEDNLTKRLDDHGRRLQELELNNARVSVRGGVKGGVGAAGAIIAAVELAKKWLGS